MEIKLENQEINLLISGLQGESVDEFSRLFELQKKENILVEVFFTKNIYI